MLKWFKLWVTAGTQWGDKPLEIELDKRVRGAVTAPVTQEKHPGAEKEIVGIRHYNTRFLSCQTVTDIGHVYVIYDDSNRSGLDVARE